MKKNLSRMLVLVLMVTFLFPTVGNAADETALTAQQKYDALAAKGIFAGINGEAALDQTMNRAQFARVAALILDLDGIGATDTKVVTEKPFSDVELGTWYIEEISAAKEAGFMVGNPDGTFNPNNDMTIQELAVATARMLGIEPEEDAHVEGAADWAAGHIKALKNQNIDLPTNYTEAATRSDLVSTTFQADTIITLFKDNEKQLEELRIAEELRLAAEEKEKQKETSPIPAPPALTRLTVATPTALPAGGAVESGTPVSLNVTHEATIYYTTDGSTPTRTNGLV